jgi:hypothetical protein
MMYHDIPDTIPHILTGAVKVDSTRCLLYGVDESDVSHGPEFRNHGRRRSYTAM